MMPSDITIANVPTILKTGLELHHGARGGLVSPGVTVKAPGSEGSSGRRMLLDIFFNSLAEGYPCCRDF